MAPLLLLACAASGEEVSDPVPAPAVAHPRAASAPAASLPAADPFTEWLSAPIPVADGFTPPVIGWTRCGDGCWTLGGGGTVESAANGVVRSVAPLRTEHLWYDDQVKRRAILTWEGVTSTLAVGAEVKRGDRLGTASALRLSGEAITGDAVGEIDPFLAARPRLPVPQAEARLAVISHDLDQLRLYVDQREIGTYEVGFGQAEGDKERRGDNRTPKGVYFVVARSRGPFDGPVGAFYGGYWIKLNYPNPWDAARGADAGLVDAPTQRSITTDWWERRVTDQGTRLGSGIGLHGWAYEWDDAGGRGMSWGCVVMHLRDAPTIYAALSEGAMVALL